ncbi:MAG TPA: hypothetical protein VF459_07100 [Caulobacteraceae bacterium]
MSRFSPVTAATEGYRVMRREPKAVLVWTVLWVAALSLVSFIKLATGGVTSAVATQRNSWEIIKSFGPLAVLLVPTLLALWVVTTAAGFRAVLRPDEKSWFFIRLGMDELRLAIMTTVAFVLVLVLGGVPASVLLFLLNPLLAAMPAMARYIAIVGAILSVCLEIWIAVRLSLIAVETFAERRFHLTAYWPLARGRFWRLFGAYLIVAAEVGALLVASLVLVFVFTFVTTLVGLPQGQDLLRRGALLGLAGAAAVFAALLFVIPSTLICACQAYAFRALADDSPTVYGRSWKLDPKVHPEG